LQGTREGGTTRPSFDSIRSWRTYADLRDGAFDDTMEFKLKRKKMVNTALNLVDCNYEKQDDIEDVTIKGAYVIVDN
jgi:hypothetical protein